MVLGGGYGPGVGHYFPTVDGQTRGKTLPSPNFFCGRQLLTSRLPLGDIAFVKCERGLRNTQESNFSTFSHLYMKEIHLIIIRR